MASLEIIRNFELYDLVLEEGLSENDICSVIVPIRSELTTKKVPSHRYLEKSVFDFPVIVDPEGIPWADGNLYMLGKLQQVNEVSPDTLKSIANDLCQFIRWAELGDINYLDVRGHYLKTPCTWFSRHLYDSIESGDLASSTAKRRMNAVIQFYRWLKTEEKIPDVKLWHENAFSIQHSDYSGSTFFRRRVATDLTRSLTRAKQRDSSDGLIYDGGTLRPLLREEIFGVRQALKSIGNTEMSLAFDFALLTGARLGSVFTLREKDFAQPLSSFDHIPKIRIGGSSFVSSKNDKEMVLLVPPALYRRIRVYLEGERRVHRKRLSKHSFQNFGASEYVFITKYGTAYYLNKRDENQKNYDANKSGNAVTQFVNGTLRKELKKEGYSFPFKFHDLRATFGLLLLEWEIRTKQLSNWDNASSPDYIKALNCVRERLGHSSLKVTEGYLTYQTNQIDLKNIQKDFEEFILGELEI